MLRSMVSLAIRLETDVVNARENRSIRKGVRKSAGAMLTELGGNVAVPSAVRNSDCTTTMRRNYVFTRLDGASESDVDNAINEDVLVKPASGGALTEIDADILGERRRRN